MKLGVPLMLAWYYHVRGEHVAWWDHIVAFLFLAVPVGFILKQPDLGTAVLVAIALSLPLIKSKVAAARK